LSKGEVEGLRREAEERAVEEAKMRKETEFRAS